MIQHFARMHKEGMLNKREFQNFQEFAKLTEGNYKIVNVPVESWKELEKSGFLSQMEERNVRYIRMPDLNDKDGFVQLAVYGEDQLNFQGWYDRFLMARMQGGEHELQNLNNLTSGRTSIVSIPMEQEVDLLKADFDTLQVNYSILPDLNIGDGEIQVVVANADLPKVEHWYRMLQEKCLSEGKEIKDFETIDMGQYRETGTMNEEAYVDTASGEMKEKLGKYEGQERGELEEKVLETENSIKSISNERYQELHNHPDYVEITINRETLIDQSRIAREKNPEVEAKGMFASRVPGTWGENERTLVLPTDQVFQTDGGKTYLAFLAKNEKQILLDANGKPVSADHRPTGADLYASNYEKVDRMFKKKELLQKENVQKEAIKKVVGQVPQKLPAMPRKGM